MSKQDVSNWLYSFHETCEKNAKTIAVTGGKGGVGKTSLAIKIAFELTKQSKKVLLIDSDYNLSNTLIKLGGRINNSFIELLSGRVTFTEALQRINGVDVLSGCSGNNELFRNNLGVDQFLQDIIASHTNEYDYIIIDCPAGLNRESVNLAAMADYRFVVATPDKSSLTDSYSLLKVLKSNYNISKNHLIVNKVSTLAQYQKIVKALCETAENFIQVSLSVLGSIPFEEGAVDKFDNLILEANNSLTESVAKVVEKFVDEHVPHAEKLHELGFRNQEINFALNNLSI